MVETLEKNKILVIGRPESKKDELVKSFISTEPTGSSKILTIDSDTAKVDWQVETRYYCASLEIWIDSTEQLPADQIQYMQRWLDNPDMHSALFEKEENGTTTDVSERTIPVTRDMEELQQHLSEVVDAVVFVFDPMCPETFADILPWALFGQKYKPSVLLCVAYGKPSGQDVGELRDKWFSWCIECGWEWVDLTDEDPDTEYTVARVREALTSNEWSTMRIKEQLAQSSIQSGPTAEAITTTTTSTMSDTTIVLPSDKSFETSIVENPQGDVERREWAMFDEIATEVDPKRVDALHRLLFDNSDPEGQGSDISALLDRVRGMRDEISEVESKEARRIKAAELAMAIAREA
ncbi:hypothetical protein COEREDRAFT_79191 [Coemansia reversa NRRL 1564]|uniref:Uncharacterized protein n=1 Tax=Coemansia reversa (strain ATCC 12441 / NRRL 1564) TaxID=763665 RepID=A0A2G5BJP2_COERN|nr:hypothetical protein COEREDRAFT_79191 [Coemansia reversa NRRL 1564]|eukprot:PIA19235.1 hypothetical protein COEREDRAFT_79191 [Coemansia reversa NRRL 1564]